MRSVLLLQGLSEHAWTTLINRSRGQGWRCLNHALGVGRFVGCGVGVRWKGLWWRYRHCRQTCHVVVYCNAVLVFTRLVGKCLDNTQQLLQRTRLAVSDSRSWCWEICGLWSWCEVEGAVVESPWCTATLFLFSPGLWESAWTTLISRCRITLGRVCGLRNHFRE